MRPQKSLFVLYCPQNLFSVYCPQRTSADFNIIDIHKIVGRVGGLEYVLDWGRRIHIPVLNGVALGFTHRRRLKINI